MSVYHGAPTDIFSQSRDFSARPAEEALLPLSEAPMLLVDNAKDFVNKVLGNLFIVVEMHCEASAALRS